MGSRSQIWLFDAAPERAGALDARLRQRGLAPQRVAVAAAAARPGVEQADLAVVVVDPAAAPQAGEPLGELLGRLVAGHLATLVWGAGGDARRAGGPLIEWLGPDVSLDEVVGKIGTLARYAPLIRGLERELDNLRRLGEQLNRHFGELDQEMRLAGRLQRDFLPRELPRAGPCRCEVLYRPASWVSGDMYDVFRIDEQHLGVFIADAMGHGVAAGLLTMFLRQALVSGEAGGGTQRVVTPTQALQNLHACLVRQQLPNCQFVTAAYGVIDLARRAVRLARAGHPYPLHVTRGGQVREVVIGGSLLGLPDVPGEFEETQLVLGPGEKLIFYTDGMEDCLLVPRSEAGDVTAFTPRLLEWARLGAAELVQAVGEHLDCAEGSLNPADDVTLLVVEAAG